MIRMTRRKHDLIVDDPEPVRDWVLARVDEEIRTKGQPVPKFMLLGSDFVEVLDLSRAFTVHPDAHPGATFQALKARPHIRRRFIVIQLVGIADSGDEHYFALVLEPQGKNWFLAQIQYTTDATTGLGVPVGEWERKEVPDLRKFGPFLAGFASPPFGARPVPVEPPQAQYAPDIQTAFGQLKPGLSPPAGPHEMAGLALQIAAGDLLSNVVAGTVVVVLRGRDWEMWVLGDDMPTTLDDMVRWVANEREPEADGVAIVLLAVFPKDVPPVPFIQVIAERDGKMAEGRGPVTFPDGPQGRKLVPEYRWWPARPVSEDGMWIGVRAEVELHMPTDFPQG